jgi:8-oxo-dGTP diphosphatase
VGDLFDEFFRSAAHNKHPLLFAAMETVRQLQHMEETIAKHWKWQIYAASVLLVRDAAREDEEWSQIDDEEKARRAAKGPGVRAVLVDFSYAFPHENVGHDNLLFGVRKLREAVSSWASRCVLPARHTTLLFLLRNNGQEILLARKKRGMGTGKFNGVGGKVEEGESELDACVRECSEEVLVHVDRASVRERGVIEFRFVHPVKSKSWDNECYIFTANYEDRFGQPTETDEMAPAWFPVSKIPFESMWQDDSIWMPRLLAGNNVHFRFWFDAQTDGIIAFEETKLK